ncbi:MAG: dimethyl sulfoxide reductase anchor subunit [Proteobacteria bacterium]|nr:dimethyl sulfoxide reductase anchor subunit [Pseudomonadota bacterium]MBS0464010.1 dimethyl sulfoxide reductase anchor subunit [Pseudomonadota bacterium]
MNPALSVIFFTTLSGAGYGLWFWWALDGFGLGLGRSSEDVLFAWLLAAVVGFVLVTVGLLSSTLHLGKPGRAWRAFSQWRTSWLSREGVASLLAYAAFVACFMALRWNLTAAVPLAAAAVALLALGTVCCTAMIYACLKTVPAWRQKLVLPGYLVFALHTGGLLHAAVYALAGARPVLTAPALVILATTSLATAWIKEGYWHAIDRIQFPSRAAATGLEGFGNVTTFERPHTQANYLTHEMGFVLARKHSARLRLLALLAFAVLPLLALIASVLLPGSAVFALPLAALAALAGAFVERWLFFAEARHLVMLYY